MNLKVSTPDQMAQARKDTALHIALLQRTGLKLADARVKAWLDGPAGLEALLLPLNTKV